MCRQRILDAFRDREPEQIVRWRDDDRQAEYVIADLERRTADNELVRLDLGFAASVGLEQRQMHADHIVRLAKYTGLGLIDQRERREIIAG